MLKFLPYLFIIITTFGSKKWLYWKSTVHWTKTINRIYINQKKLVSEKKGSSFNHSSLLLLMMRSWVKSPSNASELLLFFYFFIFLEEKESENKLLQELGVNPKYINYPSSFNPLFLHSRQIKLKRERVYTCGVSKGRNIWDLIGYVTVYLWNFTNT